MTFSTINYSCNYKKTYIVLKKKLDCFDTSAFKLFAFDLNANIYIIKIIKKNTWLHLKRTIWNNNKALCSAIALRLP